MSGGLRNSREYKAIRAKENRTGQNQKGPPIHKNLSDFGIPEGLSLEEHAVVFMSAESDGARSTFAQQLQQTYGNAYLQKVVRRAQSQEDTKHAVPSLYAPSGIQRSDEVPGIQRQFTPDAGDILTFVMTGFAAIADEVQKQKALDAAERKVPEVQALLRDNPGNGVLVVHVMKQPDPSYRDPAVRGLISWTFVGVFLVVGTSQASAVEEWETTGILTDPDYKYENHYSWIPPSRGTLG